MGIPDKIEDAGMPGIDSLIPQKPPFVMIDRLVHVGENSAIGELRVNSTSVLADDEYLHEPGLIEFMAQTAAAYTGYRQINENEAVKEGYIGSVKNLEISALPPVGSLIRAEINIDNEIVGYTLVSARVYLEDAVIASCELRILNS